MTNWYIYDNQITETRGFDISWLPPEAYQYVTPHLNRTSGLISLEASSYVGALPLKNSDTLFMIPRAGRESYSRMLLVVEGLEDAIRKEFEQFVKLGYQESGNTPWSSLLSKPFINKLRLIEKESLSTERINIERRTQHIKGKVNIVKSLTSLAKNEDFPIHAQLRETTILNLENRLLSTASAILLRVGAVESSQKIVASRWANLARENFINKSELAKIGAGLKSHKYTGSRSYYVPALVMAKLIISQVGISLAHPDSVEGEPLITNMADLFEKYVRTVISKLLTPQGYLVEKKDTHPPSLFTDGTCELKPDILISKHGVTKLLADVKYKPRPTISSSDYYQMHTYLDTFGINVGLLILPSLSDTQHSLYERETSRGKKILELRLPIGNWGKSEEALSRTITALI